jgi:hypothetical protein
LLIDHEGPTSAVSGDCLRRKEARRDQDSQDGPPPASAGRFPRIGHKWSKAMETIIYYSRNGKKPPFEVTIEIDGQLVYINCNCPLGIDKKICRHKINAIRGDREHSADSTSDVVIKRLRNLFGLSTTLRRHLEGKWRVLREYVAEHPANEEEINKKRKIFGEAFANGFKNDNTLCDREPFDADAWEGNREIYANGLACHVILKYENYDGADTFREVDVNEIFVSNLRFYISGYCHLRKQVRTFRIDRIQGVTFNQECSQKDKSTLLDVIFQGYPTATK